MPADKTMGYALFVRHTTLKHQAFLKRSQPMASCRQGGAPVDIPAPHSGSCRPPAGPSSMPLFGA